MPTGCGAERYRLRATFGDPLLVGGAGRLLPTPRGEVLLERARAVLDQVRALLSADSFDPSRSDRSFVLLVDDYFSALLLPGLARRMQSTPNLQIRVQTRGSDTFQRLLAGSGDLLFDVGGVDVAGLRRQRLWDERFVLLARKGHPAFSAGPIDLETWAAIPQMRVEYGEGRPTAIDELLAKRGLSRSVQILVPTFLAIPEIVAASDLIATYPARLAPRCGHLPVAVHPLPEPPPPMPLFQVWPERLDRDPAHQWLREQLRSVASDELTG